MVQAKINKELVSLEAELTSTDIREIYVTQSKSKNNSAIHEAEEKNLLPLQTITSDDNEESLAGTAATLSLHFPPTDNSTSGTLGQSSVKMKCYYYHKHHCFLDYLINPILEDAVISMSDIPFHYDEREGKYTEFMGNSAGTVL